MASASPTRERILEAAERIFAQKGYHDAHVDEIAEASATSKGGIYFHFASKDRLFDALMARLAERLLTEIEAAIADEPDAVAKIERALETVMDQLGKRRRLIQILLVQSLANPDFTRRRLELFDRFAELIRTHLDQAIADGEVPPVRDPDLIAHAWLGAIHELLIRWLHTGEPPLETLAERLTPLFLQGLGREPTDPHRLDANSGRDPSA